MAGQYVVAVSGGVDSVSLLHALSKLPTLKLTVAHYDHGIRPNSLADRIFVQQLAGSYGLPFVYKAGRLGSGASEATARTARYRFLGQVQKASGARAIITAHHQDDVLETALLNLIRGTGRKGLSSLGSRPELIRPLLKFPKADIISFAKSQTLDWREDSTNTNPLYLRNHIRLHILPRLSSKERQKLLAILAKAETINTELDLLISDCLELKNNSGKLDRKWFIILPHNVAKEVMATWLRNHDLQQFNRKTLERLTLAAKTAQPAKQIDVIKGWKMRVEQNYLALTNLER